MGWTYTEFRHQPARVVKRWMAMLSEEGRALEKRRDVEAKQNEARARMRRTN